MAFHFITVRVLSIYETTIGMFYLPLSTLLYWEIYSTLSLISSLAVLLWVCIASKLCILRQFCTFVFQEWRHCYLNIFLLIIFSCIIVCGKKNVLNHDHSGYRQICVWKLLESRGLFVPPFSMSAEGFNEIDNNKVVSTCRWQTWPYIFLSRLCSMSNPCFLVLV